MKSIPYKSAVIGLGNIAWKYDQAVMVKNGVLTHAEAYKLHSDTVLVGGCSPDEKDRNGFAEKYNVPVFSSVDELLQDTLPDIVSICSPAYLHFEHTCKCIASGVRMIWLEKPPALTKEEIDFIIKEQDREKVVVLVNYQRRYCQGYIRLKEIFCNKTLGEVKFVYMTYSRGLSANGSHIIDILHYILGDKVRITLASSLTSGCKGEPSFVLRTDEGLLVFVISLS
jgi:predicted dehydrogenase